MSEPIVVLLHGWPGLPSDYDAVRAQLPGVRVGVPVLAGLRDGFEGSIEPGAASAAAHAERLLAALPDDAPLVVVGYDIGSRIAQAMVRAAPTRIAGAVLTPGYPGIGSRAGADDLAHRFWYQHFHRTPLAARLIDPTTSARSRPTSSSPSRSSRAGSS
ncbi:alpha/beta fold hydrolase [Agrococcus terreus]|uniref:alpha/beta fold hydrolase n=1 Tax=Agrococcus terreus TaxID=574649 RepID=UPI00384BC2E9